MVQYVGVSHIARLLSQTGVANFIVDLAGSIKEDFLRWESFEKTPRIASHSPSGVVELMPTSDAKLYGFKYVSGHPLNPLRDLQTVVGFGVLSDVATGYPLLLSEMTVTTALRTAATSALAASHLARRGSRTMAMIGLGAQSEFQALAFQAMLGIARLRVYDIDDHATRKFTANMAGRGFEIVAANSAREAVLGADIITTATADKKRATILTGDMVAPGVHVNAIGGDCPGKTELHRDVLTKADVFVEFPEQTRIEGDIQQMPADFPVTELWRVFAGSAPGRVSESQITVFDSVGFAIEDFATLRHLHARIQGTDCYDDIDLLAEPADPRDLFGLLRAARPVHAERAVA